MLPDKLQDTSHATPSLGEHGEHTHVHIYSFDLRPAKGVNHMS